MKSKGVDALFVDFSIQYKESVQNSISAFKINKQRPDPVGLTYPTPSALSAYLFLERQK